MSVMTENTLAGSGGLRRCCSSAPDGLDYESVIRSGHYLVLVEPTIWLRTLAYEHQRVVQHALTQKS